MRDESIVIIGLPSSGKTTFLAALWHVVTARAEAPTRLRFHTLRDGDATHLNQIASRWRDAVVQDRTAVGGSRRVSMRLLASDDIAVRVTFPDVPGEAYQRMWEGRDCDVELADILRAPGVLLFIHADTIRAPKWIIDEVLLAKEVGLEVPDGKNIVDWHPRLAPTQVQLVDLLQLIASPPLQSAPRKLAIVFSAWDKAIEEGLGPLAYLEAKLPLLGQYLRRGQHGMHYRVFGLSAQGGDYDPIDPEAEKSDDAARLRELDSPSDRIRILSDGLDSRDITEPLAWLTE